jgi:kinesin family protein 11
MSADVQSEYRHLRRGIASTSRNIESFSGRITTEVGFIDYVPQEFFQRVCDQQASGLENGTKEYQNTTSTQLESISGAIEALAVQGAHEDVPTGTTPRKRVWEYVDKWELTKSRDVVLQAWREQSVSKFGSKTFLAEHLPLPEEGDDLEEDTTTIFTPKSPVSPEPENIPSAVGSPDALLSSLSSTTSNAVPAPRLPLKKAPSHRKGIPSLGTLTDARNVYTTRGPRRAR